MKICSIGHGKKNDTFSKECLTQPRKQRFKKEEKMSKRGRMETTYVGTYNNNISVF